MNRLFRLVLSVGIFALTSTLPAQELRDSKGKDFWIAFAKNNAGASTPSLFISSETATSGTVSIPGLGYSSNFTTVPGTITTVVLSTIHQLNYPDSIEDKGIHITAQDEITVYGLSRYTATTDAFLCLPTDILGDSYIIPSYEGVYGSSQLVVVGTQNATSVTITPTVIAQTRAAGAPFTITLDQGQAYQLQATGRGDLTGSLVTSSAPVAVFGSVQCANIPTTCTACDFIAEEIPPVATWGKSFIAAPLASRNGDIYRFLASEDNTTVTVNGSTVAILNQGEFFEDLYFDGLYITADKAILAIQYSRGTQCDGNLGDPFMMLIPPYEQFLGNYTISTSDSGFPANYINLVVPTSAIGDVQVDGIVVPASGFTAIGTTGFHYTAIPIAIGTHTIHSNYPVGVHVYGFGSADSYGYPGGQSLSQIAYITSITLTPPTSTAQTGSSSCVQATIRDNNANEVPGVRIDFYVNGATATSGFAFTDSNGVAQYCYTGLVSGIDSIHAVTGSLTSDTVFKTWTLTASDPVADADSDRTVSSGTSCNATITLDGSGSTDPDGGAITSWEWSGSFPGAPVSGETIDVVLPAGVYPISLTVTDDEGATGTDAITITVIDDLAPVASPIPDATGECSVTLTAPTADDNCSGTITGTSSSLTFSTQGSHTVIWTFTDDAGNSTTQEQTVIIDDITAPALNIPPDTTVSVSETATGAPVSLTAATASDNCSDVSLTARRSDGAALDDDYPVGSTRIIWKACDDNGNCDSAVQTVTISRNHVPVVTVTADTIIDEGELLRIRVVAHDSDGTLPVIAASDIPSGATLTDSGNGVAIFSWSTGCNSHGVYTITFTADDGFEIGSAACVITVMDLNFAPRFIAFNDTTAPEDSRLTLLIRTEDCDNDDLDIRAVSIPGGSSFQNNGDGTATLSWTPDCDDNGYYITVFEVTDNLTVVNDTMLIHITDVNCYDPQLTLSESSLTTGLHLPVTIAIHATDADGTPPEIEASSLPSGADFEVDGNGNAVFIWTPDVSGTFSPVFTAVDADDPNVRIDTIVIITVTDENFTGPVFLPVSDTIIDENQPFGLTVFAQDPDGEIPRIEQLELPAGASFGDSADGSATIFWTPGCSMHGDYHIILRATDGTFSDTLDVLVTVRDDNCPPLINPITDKNILYGSTLRFTVNAIDPDEDVVPEISVFCALDGYTFAVSNDGSGRFEWTANAASGTYPVTFIANDGILTDTLTVRISVNRAGSILLDVDQHEAALFFSPASGATGRFLGNGTATLSLLPGTYWFRADAPGYRPSVVCGTVTADETCTLSIALRPLIPQQFGRPETATIGTSAEPDLSGSIAFVDFDGDGIQDLSVASGNHLNIYTGSDSENGTAYRAPAIAITVPPALDSIAAHTYTDWNGDGTYECLLSLANGKIRIAHFNNEELVAGNVIIDRPGESLLPAIADINGDRKKDLLVVSGGTGMYLYINNESDTAPAFDPPIAVIDESGNTIDRFDGIPLVWDIDGDGHNDLTVSANDMVRFFSSRTDTTLHQVFGGEDFNAGGTRISTGSAGMALCILSLKSPRLAVLSDGKLLIYRLNLQGDINGDGTVNISDISAIAKDWELTDSDDDWNPAHNLRLSPSADSEVININDISRASKNWELVE
jgi:hypothetical protein